MQRSRGAGGACFAIVLAGFFPAAATEPPGPPAEGRALLQRAVELRRSNPSEAGPLLQKALALLESEGDLAGQAEAHRNLGILERLAGRNEEALQRYETALGLARRAGDVRAIADVLNSLGILYRARGDVRRALEVNAEGLDLARKGGDLIGQARLLGSIARAREELGDLEGSERAERLALTLAEKGGAPPDLVPSLSGHLAILMAKRGELWEALRLLDRIEEMPGVTPNLWGSNNTRALIYRGLGDLDRAEESARLAVEQAQRAGGVADLLGCRHNLALILEEKNDLEGAEALLRETLAGLEQLGNHTRALFALNSLAVLAFDRGDLPAARTFNERALRLIEEAGLTDPFPIEETYRTRARLARASGDLGLALEAGREATRYAEKSGDVESLANAHELMGEMELAAGHEAEAEAFLRKAIGWRRDVRTLLPAEERLMLRRKLSRPWRRLASALLERHARSPDPVLLEEAFGLLDENHARTFVEMLAQARPVARSGMQPEEGGAEGEPAAVGGAIETIQSDLLRGEPDEERRRMLERRILPEEERPGAGGRRRAAASETLVTPAPDLSLRDLQKALGRERAVLITFALGPSDGWALVVGPTSLEVVALPQWEEIARLAAEIEPLLGNPGGREAAPDPIPALDRLSAHLLDPWFGRIPQGTDRIIVVPDGILERVPFEALRPLEVQGTRSRYLVESHSVVYVPSAASWLALRRRPGQGASSGTVLAVADPEIPSTDSVRIPPLPAGRKEATRLAKMGSSRSRLLLGGEATEARWKSEDLSRFELIHLAAHGIADIAHPLRSGIVLAAGDPEEDGWIQMREILGTPLRAELVVLSACRSAAGPVDRAEGIISLPLAFLEAGARAVVATLWDVGDATSAEFMRFFYQEVAAGHRPADALRAAKLEMIASKDQRLSRAAAWAPFVLFGDASSRLKLGSSHRFGVISLGLSAAVLLALGSVFRRWKRTHGLSRTRNSA